MLPAVFFSYITIFFLNQVLVSVPPPHLPPQSQSHLSSISLLFFLCCQATL